MLTPSAAKRLEHLRRDARMRLHARAHERDPADAGVVGEAAGADLADDLLHDGERPREVGVRDGERDVGVARGRDVLHDHVDVDRLVGEGAEHLRGHAGTVGHVRRS